MPRRMKHASLVPPPRRPEDSPPAPVSLFIEPDNPIELLGEMLHDVSTMGELLRELPFERQHYRANLRLVLAAATRMRKRCERLLEEADDLAQVASPGEPLTDRDRDVSRAAELHIKLDEGGPLPPREVTVPITHPDGETTHVPLSGTREELEEARRIMEETLESPNLEPPTPPAEASTVPITHPDGKTERVPLKRSGSTRKTAAGPPSKPGGYSIAESFVMTEIDKRGNATTTEIVGAVTSRGIPRNEVEAALANLRVAKVVSTTKLGRGFINRLAS